jgi:hypothetical protein
MSTSRRAAARSALEAPTARRPPRRGPPTSADAPGAAACSRGSATDAQQPRAELSRVPQLTEAAQTEEEGVLNDVFTDRQRWSRPPRRRRARPSARLAPRGARVTPALTRRPVAGWRMRSGTSSRNLARATAWTPRAGRTHADAFSQAPGAVSPASALRPEPAAASTRLARPSGQGSPPGDASIGGGRRRPKEWLRRGRVVAGLDGEVRHRPEVAARGARGLRQLEAPGHAGRDRGRQRRVTLLLDDARGAASGVEPHRPAGVEVARGGEGAGGVFQSSRLGCSTFGRNVGRFAPGAWCRSRCVRQEPLRTSAPSSVIESERVLCNDKRHRPAARPSERRARASSW